MPASCVVDRAQRVGRVADSPGRAVGAVGDSRSRLDIAGRSGHSRTSSSSLRADVQQVAAWRTEAKRRRACRADVSAVALAKAEAKRRPSSFFLLSPSWLDSRGILAGDTPWPVEGRT